MTYSLIHLLTDSNLYFRWLNSYDLSMYTRFIPTRRQTRTRRALSLVEVVASTLIVGIMVVGALNTLGSVYKTRALNAPRLVGPGLAHELMNEVLAMPYMDSEAAGSTLGFDTGETNATRADFDDVDDYHGWYRLGAQAKDGTALPGYETWARQVTVYWADPMTGAPGSIETGLKRITVTVTSPRGDVTELIALRHKDGALEQNSGTDMTAVTWVGAELRLGNSGEITHHGTLLMNHAADVVITP